MVRLVRGTGHLLDALDVLHRDQVALRIHDGAFTAMDLTARHPRTGGLQRDLQRELTYDGPRAAEPSRPDAHAPVLSAGRDSAGVGPVFSWGLIRRGRGGR
ncbi:hypothetical protein ACFWOB_24515 [Streptomyces sp. NPDC058420]|uniref:hypothetical protein n=1 Tax=Streptomyces sp. NPDC058420 TaxID=3346489 RepID=UPI003663FF27